MAKVTLRRVSTTLAFVAAEQIEVRPPGHPDKADTSSASVGQDLRGPVEERDARASTFDRNLLARFLVVSAVILVIARHVEEWYGPAGEASENRRGMTEIPGNNRDVGRRRRLGKEVRRELKMEVGEHLGTHATTVGEAPSLDT